MKSLANHFRNLDKRRQRILAFGVGVVLLSAAIGFFFGDAPEPTVPSKEMANDPIVKSYVQIWEKIEEHYVNPPDQERLTRNSIYGMLHSLDPHSGFFGRREFSEMQDEQSSRFYGIGVTVNQRNGRIYVLGVSQGMPAEKAGLRYGDAIIAVDGHSAKGWTQSDALKHVRGDIGTKVEITVERAGAPEPITVSITRAEVPFPSVHNTFMIKPEVGYIGLTGGFNQGTSQELLDSLERLKKEGLTSLLLDLRGNPGGLLPQAVQVAEAFLPRGTEIVSVRGREGRYTPQVWRSENTTPETMPLVILLNGETASASEIVAGAMQDRARAWLVGEESFGKGLVQTVFRLRAGTGLTLTTGRYFTPSGRLIQRPYDGLGFYDYYYARRNTSAKGKGKNTPPKTSGNDKKFYTATGEEVFGGGGIKPNTMVKLGEADIHLRDACFEFTRLLVAGIIPGFPEYEVKKLEFGHRLEGTEYQITEPIITAFREFLRAHTELQIRESDLAKKLDYTRRRIRAEIITAAYGTEAAEQFLLESDEQVVRALAELPKAKQLTLQARLFPTASSKQ